MKKLLAFILCLSVSGPSWGVIALVTSAKGVYTDGGNSAASTTTNSVDTTGATLLVASIQWYPGITTDTVLTDSKSNTWNALTKKSVGGISKIMYWSIPTSVGASHTFTSAASEIYSSLEVTAWSGTHATTPFDQQNGSTFQNDATVQPGSVTPTEDNELVVCSVGITGNVTTQTALAIDGGFTIQEEINRVSNNMAGAQAYLIQTSAAAANPTWTWTFLAVPPTDLGVTIATFKAAGGAAPAATVDTQLLMGL